MTVQTHSIAFRAMNCQMGAWVVTADAELAEQRLAAVEVFMHATEASLSRFRPESELSRLNARAGETVAVSATLANVLALALASAHESGGVYDPTILDALADRASNYNRTRAELLELERNGDAMVFFPEGFTVSQGERKLSRLERSFNDGAAQVARELPGWLEWLGLA